MIKEQSSDSVILDIIEPSIAFPQIRLEKGQTLGIYTENPIVLTSNFFRLISEPEKYAKKVMVNGIIANGTNWVGRVFTHIVVPEIWEDSICNILKNKPKRRHLIFIGANSNEIRYEELANISRFVTDYKKDGSIFVITDSKELLEATVEKVIDEKGFELTMKQGDFFERLSDKTEVSELSNIISNIEDLRYKKWKLADNSQE